MPQFCSPEQTQSGDSPDECSINIKKMAANDRTGNNIDMTSNQLKRKVLASLKQSYQVCVNEQFCENSNKLYVQ